MQVANLKDMIGGWFVGDFQPTLLQSSQFEVAVKYYTAGDREAAHHHKLAQEITVVVAGRVRMGGRELQSGEMALLGLSESTGFEALEDSITVVVKTPSVRGDKYVD